MEVIKGEIEHHTNIQKNPDNIYPENEVIIKEKGKDGYVKGIVRDKVKKTGSTVR